MPTEALARRRDLAGRNEVDLATGAPRAEAASARRALLRVDATWCTAGLAMVIAYIAWALGVRFGWWTPSLRATYVIVNGTMVALYVVAAVLQWRASRSPYLDAATRSAWRVMFATNFGAFALSGTGTLRAILGITSAGGTLWQAAQPIIYVSTNALAYLALFRFPVWPKSKTERATFWLDAGTVGTAAMLLAWHLLFRGAIERASGGTLHVIEALGYPAADVMLLFATLALLLRRPLPSSAAALRVFAIGAAISVVADIPTVFDVLAAGAAKAEPYFILYVAAAWLYGAAGYLQTRNAARDAAAPAAASAPTAPSFSILPYLAVALIYVSLAIEAHRVVSAANARGMNASASTLLVLVAGAAVVTGFVVARQIVAVRRNAQLVADRLAREAYFRALVERSSDMFVVVERDGRVREASPAFARAAGSTAAALRGTPLLDCIDASDREAARADLAAARHPQGEVAPFEWRLRAADTNDTSASRWIEVVCTNLLDDAAVGALVLNGRDVSERKQLELELLHRADHDALTGLANSRTFVRHLARVIERSALSRAGFAVMYVDLDAFKPINDRHGHAAGDTVLRAVAERLRAATRGSDVVARLGGDEFAVYLDAVTAREQADPVVQRVLESLAQPIRISADDVEVSVGCSIGVAISSPESHAGELVDGRRAAEHMIHLADVAMYTAKEAGGRRRVYAALSH